MRFILSLLCLISLSLTACSGMGGHNHAAMGAGCKCESCQNCKSCMDSKECGCKMGEGAKGCSESCGGKEGCGMAASDGQKSCCGKSEGKPEGACPMHANK